MTDNPYKNVSKSVGVKDNVVEDFFSFITKGNIMDLAIGSVLGSAFTNVVNTISQDALVPVVGTLVNVDFSNDFYVWRKGKSGREKYGTMKEAENDGAVVIRYGKVLEKGITFFVQAIAIYFTIRAYKGAKSELKRFR